MSEKIEQAMAKYPKARRIAVENFTNGGTAKWDMAAAMNLGADTQAYGWKAPTVNAIKWVMKQN